MAVALDKRRLKREIERDRKAKVRARIKAVREEIKAARAKRAAQLILIRDQCRAERKALTITCDTRRAEARAATRAEVAERNRELGNIAGEERIYREVDAIHRGRRPRVTRGERRAESDDAVRVNLPADLVSVFDAVRKGIKGGPRKSRTEAFLEWAEENPGEVWALKSREAEREISKLLAEQKRLQKAQKSRRASLADVPF
jgi:hypothetical protein